MSSSSSEARETAGGRLGGARADFVASLGRKLNDARDLLTALEDDPSSKAARDELRRRLHALGSGARLLRFEAMARALQEVLAVLDRGGQVGGLREQEVSFVGEVLDDLPALAWGEAPPREAGAVVTREPSEGRVDERLEGLGLAPIAVLVVGGESVAEALTEERAIRIRAFECERTEDAQGALELARAHSPDLVLVDADHAGVPALVETLLDDAMTELLPIIVVGSFHTGDEESRFIALGVAKTLTKPVAGEALRQACDDILDAHEGRTMRVTLGEPTLEQLAERLSAELKSALLDSVDAAGRSCRVPLGEGTEVMGALWGAIARVQEVVSQRTKGAVRFGGETPEGAIALAPWLHHDVGASDRSSSRGRGAGADVRLNGRRVVVADDDPGVTWFLSDLLRTAGCEVYEALDGITARDLAFRVQPELVVSDILMPGLDGFALCRALRRDVALRDTPVMLLSWKEDLLQRVRELGASAAAYMRKESDSRAVLARVREVLRPRARIETRLRSEGEVRGRLDDLSPRLLLELVCAIRKDARVAVRDATFLYEIEIRDGAPRKATRTASDGEFQSGERALATMLAVGAGRFAVASSREGIRGELTGTLFDLLSRPIAAARGALAATTGARTMDVERIVLDADVLEEYLRATPDPARAVLVRLAGGASPRQILLAGEAAPTLVEDVLVDLAARCAILGVQGPDGADLLTPAVAAALAVLTGDVPARHTVPPSVRPSVPTPPPASRGRTESFASLLTQAGEPRAADVSFEAPSPRPAAVTPEARSPRAPAAHENIPSRAEPARASEADTVRPASAAFRAAAPVPVRPSPRPPAPHLKTSDTGPHLQAPPPSQRSLEARDDDDDAPSSLEAAVMREISDRSPAPGGVHGGVDRPPIVEPGDLRPRSSNPPANGGPKREAEDEPTTLPSFPPDAIVPATTSNEEFAVAAPVAPEEPPTRELVTPSQRPPEVLDAEEPKRAATASVAIDERVAEETPAPRSPELPLTLPPTDRRESREAREVRETREAAKPSSSRWGWVFAFVLLAGAVAAALNRSGREAPPTRPAPPVQSGAGASPSPSAAAVPSAGASAVPGASAGAVANAVPSESAAAKPAAPGDDVPAGMVVPAGSGVLQIAAPDGARVRVDGVDAGYGPLSSSVQPAGYHQVRIDQDGRNTQYVIEVRAGKTTRVKSSPLP